jgi:N-methylhydantoinase A
VIFDGKPRETVFVRRSDLVSGAEVKGPAIIVEQTATTVMPPGTHLRVDELGSLIVTVGKEA